MACPPNGRPSACEHAGDNLVLPGMSRKTGKRKRLRLYDRGNTACPICLTGFSRDQASSGRTVTLEHVPIKSCSVASPEAAMQPHQKLRVPDRSFGPSR